MKKVKQVVLGTAVLVGMIAMASGLSACGKTTTVQGTQGVAGSIGEVGPEGPAGANGYNAMFGVPTPAPSTTCPNSGNSGTAGVPDYGQVFTMGVDTNNNGTLDVSEVQQVAVVCNGANGAQGSPGIQGVQGNQGVTGQTGATGSTGATGAAGVSPLYSPVGIIQPCGATSSAYKEALLGLTGGFILSEFSGSSDGLTVRNTLLPDGSYEDTDASGCTFSVSTASNGNRTVSWNGGQATYNAATENWTTPAVSSH